MAKKKTRRRKKQSPEELAAAKARVAAALENDTGAPAAAAAALPAKVLRALVRQVMFEQDGGETAQQIVNGMVRRAKFAERDSDRQRAAETLMRYCESPPAAEKPKEEAPPPLEGPEKTLLLVVGPEDVERMAPDNPMRELVRKQVVLDVQAKVTQAEEKP